PLLSPLRRVYLTPERVQNVPVSVAAAPPSVLPDAPVWKGRLLVCSRVRYMRRGVEYASRPVGRLAAGPPDGYVLYPDLLSQSPARQRAPTRSLPHERRIMSRPGVYRPGHP